MPLDGHDFLVSQGWSGKGTGLREGSISRPLAIPQKKNLAGLGKDRDEAFPFWDHLFTAAAKSIQLKFASDDESDEDPSLPQMKRTTTGILSNRRPAAGVSASTSGANTPDVSDSNSRLNLLSMAKRNAARSNLYSRFFRGPILCHDNDSSTPTDTPTLSPDSTDEQTDSKISRDDEKIEKESKKRKRDPEDDIARRERKEKKELKAKEKAERRARRQARRVAREEEKKASEELEKREKKNKRRELEENTVEKVDDSTLKRKRKKTKADVKDASRIATIPCRDSKDEVARTRDSDIADAVPIDQSNSKSRERKKHRRRTREED